MTLRFWPDPAVTAWIRESRTSAGQVADFGPEVFEAYVRLRFIADPDVPGQAEADALKPAGRPSDMEQACYALDVLAGFTSTPDECYLALWDGYSDAPLPADVREDQLFRLPHRSYAVFRGPVSAVHGWADEFGGGQPISPPALIWPADHAWFFASDVDLHWAGIGASAAAVAALLAKSMLDVVAARPRDRQPTYG